MASLASFFNIGGMQVRNRLVFPPISTNFGTTDGLVTEESLEFYQQRSRHVGLTIVEAAAVRADGRIFGRGLGIWDDVQLPGLSELAAVIKVEGAASAIQINHAGARAYIVESGVRCPSPSGFVFAPAAEPTVMTEEMIAEFVEDYAVATERGARAGLNSVEVHGAHFYLVSQFLSPLTNRRSDGYGGDTAGRASFALEIVRAIRNRVGSDYPVIFRLNAVEKVDGGQTLEDTIVVSRLLKQAGVDVIHASAIVQTSWKEIAGKQYLQTNSCLPKDQPAGTNTPYAARIRAEVGIPVITVGKLGAPGVARAIVESGQADMVAIGRQLIVDPDSAAKLLAGHEAKIEECVECLACMNLLRDNKPIRCSTNGNLLEPAEYARAK